MGVERLCCIYHRDVLDDNFSFLCGYVFSFKETDIMDIHADIADIFQD